MTLLPTPQLPRLEPEDVEEFRHNFDRFADPYRRKKQKLEEQRAKLNRFEAPEFNIFRLLITARVEEATHSVFLAELLSPDGSHGQGYLFLRTFFEMCGSVDPNFPMDSTDLETGNWVIKTEKHITQEGRDRYLDIFIASPELGQLCVIENKVFDSFLKVSLQQHNGSTGFRIYYAVQWVDPPAKLLDMPAFTPLRDYLKKMRYTKSMPTWPGYRYTTVYLESDSFTKQFSSNPQSVLTESVDYVWNLFLDVKDMLKAANAILVEAYSAERETQ